MNIRQKKHRLDRGLYIGTVCCSFTVCLKEKGSIFSDDVFDSLTNILLEEAKRNDCKMHAYVIMPDHIHLLVEGNSVESDVYRMIVTFKQKSNYWLSKNSTTRLQKGFYDHILRAEEGIIKHVRYILNNPLRKGLVENWIDYPHMGSSEYQLEDL